MKDAKAIIWKLNELLQDGEITSIAVACVTNTKGALEAYCIDQIEGSQHGGLYQLLGALYLLQQSVSEHGIIDFEFEDDEY